MTKLQIQSPDLSYVDLVLNTADENNNPISKTFKLSYDYRGIKRAEDALGIDLRDFQKWKEIKSSMTPQLVHAGLAKYHPDVTLEEITDLLNPSAQAVIQDAIFELLFPGVMEKIQKLKADSEKKDASPNESAVVNADV